ncbi:PilZ domain-containing protein [Thiomicrorhabdus arctica]|uniref:PilZ domain-containing protein n=1 Tax=Thiomicrorhabdus arctica TaxID=131540 RepID=UPI00036CECFF|nr:PilZ domain-containing protein [Thiomicrorhabdus arctica]
MIQMDLEQRQSSRFPRSFLVTDHDDETFSEPFEGFDVNLTGLSFWLDDADLFLPGQQVSLRIKNTETDEIYCLERVEVVHQRASGERLLCGCHITQVSSAQLLSHHRIVMTDAKSALVSMQNSEMTEFDFIDDGSALSTDEGDFQEASMALNLAVSQLQSSRQWGSTLLQDLEDSIKHAQGAKQGQVDIETLNEVFQQFSRYYNHMSDTTLSLGMLAKLLAHTPDDLGDRQGWKTLIADFENRFLTEQQQVAYDFMHQGLSADEALKIATEYLNEH